MNTSRRDITTILQSLSRGEPGSADDLMKAVYADLRNLARMKMARETPGQTLQPTALVHEAWMKIADNAFENRAHFFSAAAEAMRRILIDRARSKAAVRHGGGKERVDVEEIEIASPEKDEVLLAIDEALEKLSKHDPPVAELVKIRYFLGVSFEEAAEILGISLRTAMRQWAYARAWLHDAMSTNE